jgi:putative pyruvate formate lyase activating enzyme
MLKIAYQNCQICPRHCGVNRESGVRGFCGVGVKAKVAAYLPHFGEEPMISGDRGSGAIFFSHCNLRCIYCQNFQISQDGFGFEVGDGELADMMIELQNQGVHNINLVSGAHYLPNLVNALKIAKDGGLTLPIVYNSNGYESLETLRALDGLIDIYLPDIKYSDEKIAAKYSGVGNYVEVNRAAIKEMFCQKGNLTVDEKGMAKRGLLVRHLVLPNDLAGSFNSFEFLAAEVSRDLTLAIMSQYSPRQRAAEFSELNRSITPEEYQTVVGWARNFGFENILTQEFSSQTVFAPDFHSDQPFQK